MFIVVAGVLLILALADLIVKSTVKLAEHFGFSGTFVGLTILSIGTSIPEIVSAVVGSLNILEKPEMMKTMSALVLGQNVGSDIFQQSFILAIVGILGTVIVVKKDLNKEMGALIIGAVLMLLFSMNGTLSKIEGGILFSAYIAYLVFLYKTQDNENVKRKLLTGKEVTILCFIILIMFIIMGLTADKVLESSTVLVGLLPISASFFGVLLLGVASALPELTTALIALLKKRTGISTGVLIGSNITNPLLGLGLGAAISSYTIPGVLVKFDLPFKIGTAILIYIFLAKHKDISKKEGALLIGLFCIYLITRQLLFPLD